MMSRLLYEKKKVKSNDIRNLIIIRKTQLQQAIRTSFKFHFSFPSKEGSRTKLGPNKSETRFCVSNHR